MKNSNRMIFRLAKRQIAIDKRRAVCVNLSLVFSMLILIFIYNIYTGLDLDKYVSGFIKTDFIVGTSDYFDMKYDETSESLDENLIRNIEKMEGFQEGGRLYYYCDRLNCSIYSDARVTDEYTSDPEGNPLLDLYGVDSFVWERMAVYQGTIDSSEFATGKYIICGLETDDYGDVIDVMDYQVGDSVKIKVNGIDYQYEIMAFVKKENSLNTVRYWSKHYTMYLPASEYMNVTQSERVMSYMFNADPEKESGIEAELGTLSKADEMQWKVVTKSTYMNEFNDMKNMILMVGGFLLSVISIIALMNFCNVITTSIISRKYEFAVMQAIGMTNGQMRKMLMLEGSLYWLFSNIVTVLVGSLFSMLVLKFLLESVWFLKYRFSIFPMLYISPLFLLLVWLIPIVVFKVVNGRRLVERIKSN